MEPEHQDWIRECVAEHQQALLGYTVKFLNSADRAQDVVQEAFIQLCHQSREDIYPRERQWLFTVCRNRALDILRKEKKMTYLDDGVIDSQPGSELSAPEILQGREEGEGIVSLLDRLPHNQRETIRLKFLQGMSYKEISEVTGLSVTNVGFLIHTGLKQLRSRMSAAAA